MPYHKKCDWCGGELIRTSELYCACPNGHGKLVSNGYGGRRSVVLKERNHAGIQFSKYVKAYDRSVRKYGIGKAKVGKVK